MNISLDNIRSDFDGFARLTELAFQSKGRVFEKISIDLSRVSFLAANMCSSFGAILHWISQDSNQIELSNLQPKVEEILERNGFLKQYGWEAKPDYLGTTIEYIRLEPEDDRFFGNYIEKHLAGKGIPEMSQNLRKKFMESIFEIFSNAAIHSNTKLGIFACGQLFPRDHRLDFCLADLGMGIRRNLKQNRNLDLSSIEAISWAVEGSNTTKRGPIPGGLGLKLLREFIKMNKGRIQIVSDTGYWEQNQAGEISLKNLSKPFPGTAVNIEINTADTSSYCLQSEIKPEDIF